MDELVLYATDDRVGMVTLNRPSKLNAINAELREQLVDALRTADADPSTSVVILRAEGAASAPASRPSSPSTAARTWAASTTP
jgi:enoyl-CoA hydratase/carnithine racemase